MAKDKLRFLSIKITDNKGFARPAKALLDNGSTISAMSFDYYCKYLSFLPIDPTFLQVSGYCGGKVTSLGSINIQFQIGNTTLMQEMVIVPGVSHELVLGSDFIKKFSGKLDYEFETFEFKNLNHERYSVPMLRHSELDQSVKVLAMEHFVIPAHCEMLVPGQVDSPLDFNGLTGITSRNENFLMKKDIVSAYCYVTVVDNCIPVRLFNASNRPVTIWPKSALCLFKRDNEFINTVVIDKAPISEPSAAKRPHPDIKLNFSSKLSEDQRQTLINLLANYKDIFVSKMSEIGTIKGYKYTIDVGDAKPVRSTAYQLNPVRRKLLLEQVQLMKEAGVLEEGTSPWGSSCTLLSKPDGSFKIAFDYRQINRLCKVNSSTIPSAETLLRNSGGMTFVSKFDLASGYYQLELDEESRDIATVLTPDSKSYRPSRLLYGLSNGPSVFQKVMHSILGSLLYSSCLCYLDDILVHSFTFEEHVSALTDLFSKLRAANVKLSAKKSEICQDRVKFLGYIVGSGYLSANPEKVEIILKWPSPDTEKCPKKSLQSFLGICGFFKKLIRNYGDLTSPLFNLLKGHTKFEWTDECRECFEKLKQCLASNPVLKLPEWGKPFEIFCDSSSKGLGAVLHQRCPTTNELQVICYAGRCLKSAELRMSSIERELLALLYSLKFFTPYIAGTPCIVHTDNKSLAQILSSSVPSSERIERWRMILSTYPLVTVRYVKGPLNGAADGISRAPLQSIKLSDIFNLSVDPDILLNVEADELCTLSTSNDSSGLPSNKRVTRSSAKAGKTISKNNTVGLQKNSVDQQSSPQVQNVSQPAKGNQHSRQDSGPAGTRPSSADNQGHKSPVASTHRSSKQSANVSTDGLPDTLDAKHLSKLQREDAEFAGLFNYLTNHELPKSTAEARKVVLEAPFFHISENGVLCRLVRPKGRSKNHVITAICLPKVIRQKVIANHHSNLAYAGCHQGPSRTLSLISERYYSRHLARDTFHFVRSCEVCQTRKGNMNPNMAMMAEKPCTHVHQTLHGDHCGPFVETSSGNKYIFILSDEFSKYVTCYAVKSTNAKDTAACLFDYFCRNGAVKTIKLDRHQTFRSEVLKELCQLFDVKKLHLLAYSPCSNQAERWIQNVKLSISMFAQKNQHLWDGPSLKAICHALNCTPQVSSSCYTPFYIFFGRHSYFENGLDFELGSLDHSSANYVQLQSYILNEAFKVVESNLKEARLANKKQYDSKVVDKKFVPGDICYLRVTANTDRIPNQTFSKSLRFVRWNGPFAIVSIRGTACHLKCLKTNRLLDDWVSIRRLKRGYLRKGLISMSHENPEESVEEDEVQVRQPLPDGLYEVKRIVTSRWSKQQKERYYLVEWAEPDPKAKNKLARTWEPRSILPSSIIEAYHSKG